MSDGAEPGPGGRLPLRERRDALSPLTRGDWGLLPSVLQENVGLRLVPETKTEYVLKLSPVFVEERLWD